MTIAQIVGQPATCFRDDLQRADRSVNMQTRSRESFDSQTADEFTANRMLSPTSYKAALTDSEGIDGVALGERPYVRLEGRTI